MADGSANLQLVRRELEKLCTQDLIDKSDVEEIISLIGSRISAKMVAKKSKPQDLPSPSQLRRVQTEPNLLSQPELPNGNNLSSNSNINVTDLLLQLVESEKLYVKDLQQIVDNWLNPARIAIESAAPSDVSNNSQNLPSSSFSSTNPLNSSKIFEKEDILHIFSNIEIIYNIHSELYKDIVQGTVFDVGRIFNKRINYMDAYSQYVNNFNTASVTFKKYDKSRNFQTLALKNSSDLITLLSKPLSRIDYYRSKLHEILTKLESVNSARSHDLKNRSDTITGQMIGMEEIREAIGKLQRLGEQFEKEQEMSVNSSKILKIKNVLTNYPFELVVPSRQFVRVGDLTLVSAPSVMQLQEKKLYTVILFSDVVLVTERQNKQLKYKAQISLRKASLIYRSQRFSILMPKNKSATLKSDSSATNKDSVSNSSSNSMNINKTIKQKQSSPTDAKNAISIIFALSSNTVAVTGNAPSVSIFDRESSSQMLSFCASTFEERDAWLEDLANSIDAHYNKQIFGIPLFEFHMNPIRKQQVNNGIPIILLKFTQFFDETALKVEGCFRISASLLQVQSYIQTIDEGTEVSFLPSQTHLVCSLLKTWFRELPGNFFVFFVISKEPLIPFSMHDQFTETVSLTDQLRVSKLKELVQQMQNTVPAHFKVLKFLIPFLQKVSSFSQHNKMTAKNLGIVFEPNILRKKSNGSDVSKLAELAHSGNHGQIVETMINHFAQIFG